MGPTFGGANLQEANLDNANLQEAGLWRAHLQEAKLEFTKNLTREQLDEACGDDETKLPDYLSD